MISKGEKGKILTLVFKYVDIPKDVFKKKFLVMLNLNAMTGGH